MTKTKKVEKYCRYCDELLHTPSELDSGICLDCSGWDDYDDDPMERNMDEQMRINIGMGD